MRGGSTTNPPAGLPVSDPAPARALRRRLWRDLAGLSPWRVAGLVGLLYLALVLGSLVAGRSADLAYVGHRFVERTGTSAAIAEHAHATSRVGYDGQFALFIALDPAHAAPSMDKPAYRYSHILYPLVARAAALGHESWVPASMILVNVLAVVLGTLALALILKRSGEAPVLASAFGLFPGLLVAFAHDLGDVLAYSLVPVAVLALRWDRWSRILLAGLVFAAAGLARESTLFFPAVLALWHVVEVGERRPVRVLRGALLAGLAAAPYVALRAFLVAWLGPHHSVPSGLAPFPFEGILRQSWITTAPFEVAVVVLPALLLGFAALGALRGRATSPFVLVILVQVVVFAVFLPEESYADYNAAGRLQTGTVVAALCAVPALRSLTRRFRKPLRGAIALGMLPVVLFVLSVLVAGAA